MVGRVWNTAGVRLLALLLILLTTLPFGAGAVRVIAAADEEGTPCHGCDDDTDDCSPVCSDCVGSFATRLVVSRAPLVIRPSTSSVAIAVVADVALFDAVASPPRAPKPSGIFHPPRA